jgi:hypothetical protein
MSRDPLIDRLAEGLAGFTPAELRLFALAVLHGVPVTRLGGNPQDNVDTLIDAQKKLRRFLTEAGFGIADLDKHGPDRGGSRPRS